MLINWFTVFAQIINFLILLLLLKRFLYGPIVKAMQNRENSIIARMDEAGAARQQALEQKETLEREKRDFEQNKENILNAARREVRQWHDAEQQKAREEVERFRDAWLDGLEKEQDRFDQELKIRVAEQVLNVSRKVLGDLTDDTLEHRAIQTFIKKLGENAFHMDGNTLQTLREFVVRSAFELNHELKSQLENRIRQCFPKAETIAYDVKPAIGFGISLLSGDWKIEWNLAWYLDRLENAILPSMQSGRPE